MTGLSLLCMFVCLVCAVFCAIVIKKITMPIKTLLDFKDQMAQMSSLSQISGIANKK